MQRAVDDFASRIWNADETGFCLGATSKKILARKGRWSIRPLQSMPVAMLLVLGCLHLSYTCTRERISTPLGQKGDQLVQCMVLDKQFYPVVKHLLETGPVVLFIDGHYSHSSLELITRARSLGIHLFCLPPNTTHLLQPLDIGVFGPVKQCWRKILKQYKIKTRATNVTKEHFPGAN